MRNDSVEDLLKSGEIQLTEDVAFMLDTIVAMLNHGLEYPTGSILGLAVDLLKNWRESLEDTDTTLADEAIANIVMGKQ